MLSKITLKLTGASVLAMVIGAPAAFAQTATDVQGGQVVVEQEDATVDVTVPEPDVNVTQGAPVVTVDQPQPEITVVVPEPTVRVQQQAPIITIEQAQPQVTVVIPEPTVTIMVPEPEVDVATGEPIIDVDQPEPIVRFVRPEPKITIQEAEPNIQIERAEANVDVSTTDEAQIDVTQEDAQVNVQQADGANVVVEEATEEANVSVTGTSEADVTVDQGEARVVVEDFNADESGVIADADDRERYRSMAAERPIFGLTADELVGRNVLSENGEDVGEIDFVGRRGDTIVVIIGVGGFLGMGENEIALPIDQIELRDNEVILPGRTEAELKNMPEFNESEVQLLDPGMRLAEALNLD